MAFDESRVPRGEKPSRRSFEKLVREVSAILGSSTRRQAPVGEVADELGEHPWRVADAAEAVKMMGGY